MIRRCPRCDAQNRIPEARLDASAKCGHCKAPIGPLDTPIAIESDADFDALVDGSPLPVLVDFWAAWCGPCRAVAPELEKLALDHAGRLVVAKLDTEALPAVAARYGIRSIPTMILFRNGSEGTRLSGAMPHAEIARRLGL